MNYVRKHVPEFHPDRRRSENTGAQQKDQRMKRNNDVISWRQSEGHAASGFSIWSLNGRRSPQRWSPRVKVFCETGWVHSIGTRSRSQSTGPSHITSWDPCGRSSISQWRGSANTADTRTHTHHWDAASWPGAYRIMWWSLPMSPGSSHRLKERQWFWHRWTGRTWTAGEPSATTSQPNTCTLCNTQHAYI